MKRLLTAALLLTALAGCKRAASTTAAETTPAATGATPTRPAPTSAAQALSTPAPGGGGSGGAVQAVRGAVVRTITQHDMKNIHILIETASSASGQMPSREYVVETLKREPSSRNIVAAVEAGDVVVTGTRSREGVWAYEKAALTTGGMVVTASGVERMTPQQLRPLLQGN